MRNRRLVGVALLGVLVGCGDGSGPVERAGPASGEPASPLPPPPSPTATQEGDAGAPPAVDGGAGRADAQAAGDGSRDAPATITVSGLLLGSGAPLPYTAVSISGQPPVFTDASGAFRAEAVTAPYDLAFGIGGNFMVLHGLTNPTPTVSVPSGVGAQGTVQGFVSGVLEVTSSQTGVLYVTPAGAHFDTAQPNGAFGYPDDVYWAGGPQQSVDIYTLEWGKNALSELTFSTGHAVASVQQGGTTSNIFITPTGVATANIRGAVALPAGYSVQDLSAAWTPDPRTTAGAIPFFDDTSGSTSFDFAAPQAGTVVVTAAMNMPPDGRNAFGVVTVPATGGSPVTVTMPQAPQLILPIDDTTGVSAKDTFSWAPTPGLSFVVFQPSSGRNAPAILLFTEEGSSTLPDLGALGVTFPRGASYTWEVAEVTGMGPHPVDAMTSGSSGAFGLPVGIGSAASFVHTFTTAQ